MAPVARTIQKVLVANRGEIARRVFRTCKSMGVGTVAVFSDADAAMPFVRDADQAVRIGPAPSRESYLVIEKVLDAAKRTGADAIHPGYGFLSENAEFAEACAAAGIVFIGPPPAAMRAMGLKREAKITAAKAGVPVVPGFHREVGDAGTDDAKVFATHAASMGYPVLLKASAGGGGKGMRIVRSQAELATAVDGAKREALAAFGSDTLILEKYVEAPRHVEIQILGDAHGNLVHLFERECSVQRRYQKIVEESPSPALDAALRAQMGKAAVDLARTIGYQNAGTVEFILAPNGEFYFLEVNTRLQVEHPVTECVTGLDLVREQILVAEGHALGFTQSDLVLRGAAMEVRVYAEDPAEGMLPQSGVLHDWHLPVLDGVRVESGVETGSEVGIHYDPMLAKVIGFGASREEARRRLTGALERLSIAGVRNNREQLLAVLAHPDFIAGKVDTHFLDTRFPQGFPRTTSDSALHDAAVAAVLLSWGSRAESTLVPGLSAGFRNNRFAPEFTEFACGDVGVSVSYAPNRDGSLATAVRVEGVERASTARLLDRHGPEVRFEVGGIVRRARVITADPVHTVLVDGESVVLAEAPRFPIKTAERTPGSYVSPMPGKVQRLHVKVGDTVAAGDVLLVLEAMKMEHTIKATEPGVVSQLFVATADQIAANHTLLVVTAP
jgi:acetyl-CoA carboxylase biotin carboxylase subunit